MQVLFYIGLFIAGITSSFGVFTGAPRVMQGIGEDVHVFGIEQFKVTFGKNEEPMRALFFVAILTACMSETLYAPSAMTKACAFAVRRFLSRSDCAVR